MGKIILLAITWPAVASFRSVLARDGIFVGAIEQPAQRPSIRSNARSQQLVKFAIAGRRREQLLEQRQPGVDRRGLDHPCRNLLTHRRQLCDALALDLGVIGCAALVDRDRHFAQCMWLGD